MLFWSKLWRGGLSVDILQTSSVHIKSSVMRYSNDNLWMVIIKYKNAWMGNRKFCHQIPRKQLLMNARGKEQSLHKEQKERGITGDFLTLVIKDQRHEYLTRYYQMKSVKVWQVSLKLDEQSFFKTRILQQRLGCYYSSYQYYNYCPYHSKCPRDCLDMRTPISPDHRSMRTLESPQQWTLSDCWIWTAVTFISLTKCRPALILGGWFLDIKTRHHPLLPCYYLFVLLLMTARPPVSWHLNQNIFLFRGEGEPGSGSFQRHGQQHAQSEHCSSPDLCVE